MSDVGLGCGTLCGLHVYVLLVRITSHYFASVVLSVSVGVCVCMYLSLTRTVRVYVNLAGGVRNYIRMKTNSINTI